MELHCNINVGVSPSKIKELMRRRLTIGLEVGNLYLPVSSQDEIRFPVSVLYIEVKAADFFPGANNSRLNMKI